MQRYGFTPPVNAALRWLTNPGPKVSPRIAEVLLGELFSSAGAVIAGVLNGLVLNGAALLIDRGSIFALFIVADVCLAFVRITVVRRAMRLAASGMPTPTDLYLVTAGAWCALQGAMAFTAMRTDIVSLQLLAATTVMGLIGPICARNYAAPRYAFMLIGLCIVPFVAGAAMSGDRWLLVLILQMPFFLFGLSMIVKRFQGLAVSNLEAEQNSRHHARHDSLTGLLNRFGLMERLDARLDAVPENFVLFYLDLALFEAKAAGRGVHRRFVSSRLRAEVIAVIVAP